jgi:lysophospholipase L1-like esterase
MYNNENKMPWTYETQPSTEQVHNFQETPAQQYEPAQPRFEESPPQSQYRYEAPVKEKKKREYVERRNDGTYGEWYRQVAEETGCAFLDVHNITADALQKMGKEKAAAMYNRDHTHTSLAGAQLNAQSVAKGLKKMKSPLAKLLK